MTLEQVEQKLREHFRIPDSPYDEEELETYLLGLEDPKDYFSKIDSEAELYDDFLTFVDGGQEREHS